MPGHKGVAALGMEHLDITEIQGADSLYEADGIIAQSEANASALFGCRTIYSTEGSSQCIRAMLYLISLYARQHGRKNIVAAGRNAHKAFLTAAALVDVLKAHNNGEICDNDNGYSYQFSNISIGVYREALPDEITEMIEEAKNDGNPMSDDEIAYEMKRANHWAAIGVGVTGYYQR